MDYNEALVFMVMMEVKARYKPVSQNGERTGFWKDAAFPVLGLNCRWWLWEDALCPGYCKTVIKGNWNLKG